MPCDADFQQLIEWQALDDDHLLEEAENVVRAPAGALFREGDQWCLFVVEGARARQRAVRIGRTNGLETEIVQGAAPGDVVILHPSDKVRDGAAVRPR